MIDYHRYLRKNATLSIMTLSIMTLSITKHNDIQHNNKQNATLSIMAEPCYAECHLC